MEKGEKKMPRYINADKIISHLNDEIEACGDPDVYFQPVVYGTYLGLKSSKSFIETAETADVQEVRRGHWILLRESEITGFNPEFAGRDPIGGYQCSNCKEVAILDCNDEFVLSRYCPHCGAIMCKDVK